MPFTRIEICLFSVLEDKLCVLLGLREREPDENHWALPGGVLRTDLDDDLDAAVQRVSLERLNMPLAHAQQQLAVGGKNRDPRDPWALSIVYRACVRAGSITPTAGKRLKNLEWVPVAGVASLALGHRAMVMQAVHSLRAEVERLQIPFDLLAPVFTLTEVQRVCEAVLERPQSASRFRQRLKAADLFEPVADMVTGVGMGRPAQQYKQKDSPLKAIMPV